MTDVARVLKAHLPARKIPTGTLPDLILRIAAMGDPVVRGRLFELGKVRMASSEKARRDLSWTPRPVERTIIETADSLIALKLA